MKLQQRSLAVGAVVMLAAPVAAMASTVPAVAAVRLGGVNVQQACYTQATLPGLVARYSNYNNPYSWTCNTPYWPNYVVFTKLDMNRACATQYGRGASAGLAANNVYGWYCKR